MYPSYISINILTINISSSCKKLMLIMRPIFQQYGHKFVLHKQVSVCAFIILQCNRLFAYTI